MWLKDLCLGSINYGVLAKEATQSGYQKYFAYVYCHMKVYVTDRTLCKDEYILAHVVGEEYAAFLPKHMKIEEESAAKLHFTSVVRSALKSVKAKNPNFSSCFPQGLTYESYERNRQFEIGYKEGSELKKYPDPFKNPADFRSTVSRLMEFNNKKADIGAMFEVAYDIVLMLALMMFPVRVNLPKEVMFLTFVSFSKKGLAGEAYIKKVETVVKEELQLSIELKDTQIKKLWKYYEPIMRAEMMEHCVKLTLAELPEESARLRKMVELCKWHGLTCYRAVKQALELPRFPRAQLTKIAEYKTEMKAYEEAAKLVGDNSLYGYNPTMGKAKSVHYKNLASVCARILVETKKSPALKDAACFLENYQSKYIVDKIITEYLHQEKATRSKEKTGQLAGNVSTAGGHRPRKAANPGSTSAQVSSSAKAMLDFNSKTSAHNLEPSVTSKKLVTPISSGPDAFNYDFDDDFDFGQPDYDFDEVVLGDLDCCDSYDVHDEPFGYEDDFDYCINSRDQLDYTDSD